MATKQPTPQKPAAPTPAPTPAPAPKKKRDLGTTNPTATIGIRG